MITPSTLQQELKQLHELVGQLTESCSTEQVQIALECFIRGNTDRSIELDSIAATLRLIGSRAYALAGVLKEE